MGTQTTIADKIRSKGADYILAVKGNQPTLEANIALYAETEVLPGKKETLLLRQLNTDNQFLISSY